MDTKHTTRQSYTREEKSLTGILNNKLNQSLYRAKCARNLKTVLRSEERIATQEQ